MNLKEQALNCAIQLLNLLDHCDDDDFVESIVDAVYSNDSMALWEISENQQQY